MFPRDVPAESIGALDPWMAHFGATPIDKTDTSHVTQIYPKYGDL